MSDENDLRRMAREAIRAGTLPNRRPEHVWGGAGADARCAVCGELIGRQELELELQFATGTGRGEGDCHMHVRCFSAWELERGAASAVGLQTPQPPAVGGPADREPALRGAGGIGIIDDGEHGGEIGGGRRGWPEGDPR